VGHIVLFRGFYDEEFNKDPFYYDKLFIETTSEMDNDDNTEAVAKSLEKIQIFTFGSILTEGYAKIDSLEKPYFVQKFLHNYKLEIIWAFFPTFKCFTIIGPSLILLFSIAAIKIYDHTQHVTGNQWY